MSLTTSRMLKHISILSRSAVRYIMTAAFIRMMICHSSVMLTVWSDGEMVSYCFSFQNTLVSPRNSPGKKIILILCWIFSPCFAVCDSGLWENSRSTCESHWEHFTLCLHSKQRMNELKQKQAGNRWHVLFAKWNRMTRGKISTLSCKNNILPASSLPALKDNTSPVTCWASTWSVSSCSRCGLSPSVCV